MRETSQSPREPRGSRFKQQRRRINNSAGSQQRQTIDELCDNAAGDSKRRELFVENSAENLVAHIDEY